VLIELVIVLLFFSLSAAVILQLFVAAHERSVRSEVASIGTLLAEDISGRFAVSELVAEDFFAEDGWTTDAAGYMREAWAGDNRLTMTAHGGTEKTPAGMLDQWTLTVFSGEDSIISVPMARYVPEEGRE